SSTGTSTALIPARTASKAPRPETPRRRSLGVMGGPDMYHDGSRELQDRFDSRRIADRLDQITVHERFSDDDRAVIQRSPMVFLATTSPDGWPDCSYKGGQPGFVKVTDDRTLSFPNYDGNGMFRSLGNVLLNPKVGLLFIDFEHPNRMRINGTASLHDDPELL